MFFLRFCFKHYHPERGLTWWFHPPIWMWCLYLGHEPRKPCGPPPKTNGSGISKKNAKVEIAKKIRIWDVCHCQGQHVSVFSGWVFRRKMSLFVPLMLHMYRIFTYILRRFMVNFGKYSIHEASGYRNIHCFHTIVYSPNGLVIAITVDCNCVEWKLPFFWTLFKRSLFPYHPRHDILFPYIWIAENIRKYW